MVTYTVSWEVDLWDFVVLAWNSGYLLLFAHIPLGAFQKYRKLHCNSTRGSYWNFITCIRARFQCIVLCCSVATSMVDNLHSTTLLQHSMAFRQQGIILKFCSGTATATWQMMFQIKYLSESKKLPLSLWMLFPFLKVTVTRLATWCQLM